MAIWHLLLLTRMYYCGRGHLPELALLHVFMQWLEIPFFYFKYKFIKAIEDTVNTLCVHDRTVFGELWANIYISIIKEKYGQTNKIWTFYELRSHRKRGFKNYIHSGKKKKYQIFIIQLSPCRNTQLLCICGFYFLQGFHVKL